MYCTRAENGGCKHAAATNTGRKAGAAPPILQARALSLMGDNASPRPRNSRSGPGTATGERVDSKASSAGSQARAPRPAASSVTHPPVSGVATPRSLLRHTPTCDPRTPAQALRDRPGSGGHGVDAERRRALGEHLARGRVPATPLPGPLSLKAPRPAPHPRWRRAQLWAPGAWPSGELPGGRTLSLLSPL